MKIIHFSDTHLGFNDLDIVSSEGINQREQDFYDAFADVVEAIKKIKPDYIIHTGDLFHRSSPSNRAITFALYQFNILNALNIPTIIIAGNHSTPRMSSSAPILKIFDELPNIYAVYDQKYEKIKFDEVIFHAIPHINDEDRVIDELNLCEKSVDKSKKNIMMMHCSVGGDYLMQEFGEWIYPNEKRDLFKQMDYVALGHWHGFKKATKDDNVFYSGSTERTSLNDKRNSKGYVLIDLDKELKVEYKEIKIRKILSFEIDCSDYESSIEALELEGIGDAILEVKLTNLTPTLSLDITNSQIKELFSKAMHVSVKREFILSQDDEKIENLEALSFEEYFLDFVQESVEKEEFERIKLKTKELFKIYEEAHSDTE